MFKNPTLLTTFLKTAAQSYGDAVAVEDDGQILTYRDLELSARAVAGSLMANGVGHGDRVVLCMTNSVAFCAAFWGIVTAGAVAVPVNPGTKESKLAFILGNCAPKALILDTSTSQMGVAACRLADHAVPVFLSGDSSEDDPYENLDALINPGQGAVSAVEPPLIDQDLAAIIYTSGSTGDPKGVMLSHLNMTSAARSVSQYLGYTQSDRIFCAIPMTFDYGLHQLTMSALIGAHLVVAPSFTKPFFALQHLARSGATVFPIVPTMVPLIAPLCDRFDLSRIRLISSTAAALHAELIDKLQELFPSATVFSMYGLTECHRCTYLPPAQLATRKTSVGLAIPNTQMWVVDDEGRAHEKSATGQLVIRGSTVMKGYWNNPEATARMLKPGPMPGEQVLYTGDTCRLDDEGYLYFVARSDDILKVRGEKVAPSEVERSLVAHPKVSEVCVMGETHPVHGQCCVAYACLEPGADLSGADLIDWCKTKLDPHAVPSRVSIVDAMPRSMNGKIDRGALRALFQSDQDESQSSKKLAS